MPYKEPNIPTYEGLTGIEKRVQDLQVCVATLSWMDQAYGLCKRITDDEDAYPGVSFSPKKDMLDLRPWPNDAKKSYSFWDLNGTSEADYFDNTSRKRYPRLAQPVALIVMLNNELISQGLQYNITHSVKRNELLKLLNNNNMSKGIFEITGIIENNVPAVFSGFDVEDKLMEPYSCFRVEGIINYKLDC